MKTATQAHDQAVQNKNKCLIPTFIKQEIESAINEGLFNVLIPLNKTSASEDLIKSLEYYGYKVKTIEAHLTYFDFPASSNMTCLDIQW